jgi:pyruvate formate lyase activating enzyme
VANGTIFRVERFAIHDGPGIRTTVFLKGCPLACAWCHSPESQSPAPEFMPRADRCVRCGACAAACPHDAIRFVDTPALARSAECDLCGSCAEACPSGARELVGRRVSVDDVLDLVEKDRIFYDQSRGGVTFSGGEPLMQAAFLLDAVARCRERGLHTAVDTSGYGDQAALLRIADHADLFLFDVKIVDEPRHLTFTGVDNRLILDNLRALAARHPAVVVRFPLVPGVNDDENNVAAVGRFVASLGLPRVDVLPYHRAGTAKYHRLNREYRLDDTRPPTREDQDAVTRTLEGFGLIVTRGGSS